MEKYIHKTYTYKVKEFDYEMFTELCKHLSVDSYLFEFAYVIDFEKIQKCCPSINLDKYKFIHAFENRRTSWNTEDDIKECFISNLDENWDMPSPVCRDSLSVDEFFALLNCTKKCSYDYVSFMVGLNGIKWDSANNCDEVGKGTYGYEKAKKGLNFLSNSVIIIKDDLKNKLNVVVSYHERYENGDVLADTLSKLGKCSREQILYAPSDEEERKEWDIIYQQAKDKFKKAVNRANNMEDALPYLIEKRNLNYYLYPMEEIKTKKLTAQVFKNSEWTILPDKDPQRWKITIKKEFDKESEETLFFYIANDHKGHHLQTLVTYSSKFFSFSENLHYYLRDILDEKETLEYLENIKVMSSLFADNLK